MKTYLRLLLVTIAILPFVTYACGGGGGGGENHGDSEDSPSGYTIDYAFISYRNYESDPPCYKVWIEIKYDGSPIDESDVVDAFIFGEQGIINQNLTNSSFLSYQYMGYKCDLESCSQNGPINDRGPLLTYAEIPAGDYTVEVEMESGPSLFYGPIEFSGMLELPYVSSNTMSNQWSDNDLILSWSNPNTEKNWNEVQQLRLFIFDDTGNLALLVSATTDYESVTLPAELVAEAVSIHDSNSLRSWYAQTRAFDSNGMNFARANSAEVIISNP